MLVIAFSVLNNLRKKSVKLISFFLVLNRVFYLTNFDYSYIMGKENLEKE